MASHVSVEMAGDGAGGAARIVSGALSESGRAGIVVYGDPNVPGATTGHGGARYGLPMVEMGELSDGDYGFAAVNDFGQLVKITDMLFGLRVAEDNTQQQLTSDQWSDLTTPGPEITLKIGDTGRALIFWAAQIGWQAGPSPDPSVGGFVAFEVSGATGMSLVGSFDVDRQIRAYSQIVGSPGNETDFNVGIHACSSFKFLDNLNPGLNTFKMRYRGQNNVQTIDFAFRRIFGIPL